MKQNTYSKQTAKFIANLVQNIPEMSEKALQYWIENASELKRLVTDAFQPDFFIERTIKVGVHKTPENLLSAIKATGASIRSSEHGEGEYLLQRLGDAEMSTEEREVDITFVNTSLVQYHGKHTQDLCSYMETLGCECLTPEMVGVLFLNIIEKPLDEEIEKKRLSVYGARPNGYRIGYDLASKKEDKPATMTCREAHHRCGGEWVAFVVPRK